MVGIDFERVVTREPSKLTYTDIQPLQELEEWSLVIRPHRRWFELPLAEVWHYRDLLMIFVWRDFVAVYKQTILGPLWYLVQPLLTTFTFTIVFGNIAGLPTEGTPQFLFYLAGTVIWGYFAACLTGTSSTFTSNAGLFGKVYFPRLIVPLTVLVSKLISFGIQFGMFLLFLVYFLLARGAVHLTIWVLATPLLVAMMAGFGLGFGLIVSALTTRYRDLQFLVTFGVQLFMYASPVIFPLSAVPENYRWLVLANPMTPIIETFRAGFLGAGTASLALLGYSFGFMVVILLIGLVTFHSVEATFMDTI